MVLNILIFLVIYLVVYYIHRYIMIIKANYWWAQKVENYLLKKYGIDRIITNNSYNEEVIQEAYRYINHFPETKYLLLNNKINDLRTAFEDKQLFDKVVKLKT